MTLQARNAVLYVSSRVPNALRPVTPSPCSVGFWRLDLESIFTPGIERTPTSGITITVPVKSYLENAKLFIQVLQ